MVGSSIEGSVSLRSLLRRVTEWVRLPFKVIERLISHAPTRANDNWKEVEGRVTQRSLYGAARAWVHLPGSEQSLSMELIVASTRSVGAQWSLPRIRYARAPWRA